ncbi:unnamed protein product [Arabidopsis lyrata]|nr:unnamed protein product [Arabidopsis lyrata]
MDGCLLPGAYIQSSIESTVGAVARAAQQKILFSRPTDDRILPYTSEKEVVDSLNEAGFGEVYFLPLSRLEPIVPDTPSVTSLVKLWLTLNLPISEYSAQ